MGAIIALSLHPSAPLEHSLFATKSLARSSRSIGPGPNRNVSHSSEWGRGEYAGRLLRYDPTLAFELRIGPPDLPRNFDDGA